MTSIMQKLHVQNRVQAVLAKESLNQSWNGRLRYVEDARHTCTLDPISMALTAIATTIAFADLTTLLLVETGAAEALAIASATVLRFF